MLRELKFLAIVPDNENVQPSYYAYFFCKETKQILMFPINGRVIRKFVNPKRTYTEGEILFKALESLNIRKVIFKYQNNHLVSLIQLKIGYKTVSYMTPFSSGLITSQILKIPIAIESKTLEKEGIYITKEILASSLAENLDPE